MTGQIHFNSHVWVVTDVACRLVNALTAGHDGTRPVEPPPIGHRADAVRAVLERDDYQPALSEDQANALAALAERVREVFRASSSGDVASAACRVNDLLEEFGAAPRLDPARGGGWTLHFHGRDASIVVGWGAGIAAGLGMAIGSDLAGRLGVCQADPCDRVYIDTSYNLGKRFCSRRCQSRVKAAAHRAKSKG
ncbi:MAG TPA: CGNR zinc finger domain-containing protein [Trebonia sp.]|nr:CGNR zinc finger domain-containing protein [Trebonia sp.]